MQRVVKQELGRLVSCVVVKRVVEAQVGLEELELKGEVGSRPD